MKQRAAGFTLIELLVVFAIAAIIIAVVPVSLERVRASAQYRDTLRALLSDMRTARAQSLEQGVEKRFSVDLRKRSFGIAGGTAQAIPPDLTVKATVASGALSDQGVSSILFLPSGGASGGSIELVRPSGAGVRLRVDWLTGRVDQTALPQ